MTDKPDIVQTAQALGCLPEKQSGSRLYGDNCPGKHGSKEGRCFNVWEDTQSFFCFHCRAGGDAFNLIKLAQGCGFKDALSWAKEHGLISGNGYDAANYATLRKAYQILTDAARFFNSNLKDLSHLKTHYGLSEDTIQQYLIGYGPTDKHALTKHLTAHGHKLVGIKTTGLLGKFDYSFFQGQYIFPYWNQGLVKYFIGRQTPETPTWKHGKYEKLPTSALVKNAFFYGEDSIRKASEVYITEGVTDCLAALQHSLPSISPVTVQFKKSDHPRLLSLVRGKRVYLIPDNEENEAGIQGAQETLSFLRNNGIEACIITLPRPEGKEKIDLNEYLRDHGIEAFKGLVEAAPEWRQEPTGETAAATAASEDQPDDESVLPVIKVNNRQLRDTTVEAVAALHTANDPPELFVRMGELARVVVDENDTPSIKSLDESGLRHYLTAAADFVKKDKKSKELSPPKDLVQNILAESSWPFPALKGIVEVPVLRPDGSILATPGYDPATNLYYRPMPGFDLPQLLERPEQKDAKEAALFFQEELLGDFPLVDQASKANAMASYLTPIVRHAILGPVPVGINSATDAGTGKTMMQEMIGEISRGRPTPLSPTPFQGDKDAEWSKVITAELLKGSTIICFDNVDGLVRSPSLASAITARVHSGRILGLSKTVEIPVNVSWFINGNNIQLGGDLPRRCYWMRLDAKMSRPWKRKGFKHKDLWAWVTANRGRLIVALLTMARAWYLAGCPEPDVPALGGFGAWTRTVGGILQYAGVEGFLGNSEEMYEVGDVEGQEWEAFLAGWHDLYGEQIRFVGDILAEIKEEFSCLRNLLPGNLAGAHGREEGFGIALGWALAKKAGTRYGPRGLHLVRVPKGPGVRQTGWRVLTSGVDDVDGG
jgi:DNA primase